ncbi:UNVERIFIED_CONTAM: Cleavage stimulation factor subunit [Sesamum calycinum]|uniref:Cleavage stimulation factor subunit n=1 Tax=Sesamum calycinum TaxID=2727403 RepID=A0AAW2R7U3_9LAMI
MASETAESNPVSVSDGNADKYNVEAAEILANEALRSPISDAVPIYEQLLATFPTSAKYWKQYVEAFMAANNDEATRQVFSRCLLNCLQVPLWRCYIRFIRKVNDKKGIEGQEETKKAYEFMLSYVGADIASGPVWMEYIAYLKSVPAQTTLEESQRMTAIRKTYQRAIVMPTHHVEQLWRDYENFENSVSRALAKGLLAEYQPKYNSARAVYRERKKYVDEIDWNMLAIPPSGSSKEEMQWTAWKRLLSFEKGNPQRIDNASANKRIAFAYEQCLMYLYHYPDIWYDYAMWHAQSGSRDSAIKVFQRALKALPDSEMLKYAYAELEESHGAAQAAKKVYESLLGDGSNATALSHIQFIRFLRRTEGVEAARRYFLDARKSPNCTYHVYVAYAMMAFCLDKDAKVWKRFVQFEQMYGDLSSMLKVEQRRKEALSQTGENGESTSESSLQDVVSRYSFLDLRPCSSKDYDHLARQEWLSRNVNKKVQSSVPANGAGSADQSISGIPNNSNISGKVVHPDVSRMVTHGPRQQPGAHVSVLSGASTLPNGTTPDSGGTTSAINDVLKVLPPSLATFVANLPAVEGTGGSGGGWPPRLRGRRSPNATRATAVALAVEGDAGRPDQIWATASPSSLGAPRQTLGRGGGGWGRARATVALAVAHGSEGDAAAHRIWATRRPRFRATPVALVSGRRRSPRPWEGEGGGLGWGEGDASPSLSGDAGRPDQIWATASPSSMGDAGRPDLFWSGRPEGRGGGCGGVGWRRGGPSPDVDFVISICLQSNITTASRKSGTPQQLSAGPAPSTSDLSGSSKFKQTRDRQPGKRKDSERQDDDDTSTVQSQPLPRDAFKIRQLQKSRATSSRTGGSASYGSGFSGDLSGSSG